jgi:hypothetical protein
MVADKPFSTARPEGPAAAQQEYRLEDGCLAGTVFPGDQIELRGKLELRGLNATEVLDAQLG